MGLILTADERHRMRGSVGLACPDAGLFESVWRSVRTTIQSSPSFSKGSSKPPNICRDDGDKSARIPQLPAGRRLILSLGHIVRYPGRPSNRGQELLSLSKPANAWILAC